MTLRVDAWCPNCGECKADAATSDCLKCGKRAVKASTMDTPIPNGKAASTIADAYVQPTDASRVVELGKLYDLAVPIAARVLKGEKVDPVLVEQARFIIAQWSKARQTDTARAALNFALDRAVLMADHEKPKALAARNGHS